MIPQNFAIPVGVDQGVFPLFLNSGEYDNNYKQLGNNAKEFSKNFKWEKIVKKYIELI